MKCGFQVTISADFDAAKSLCSKGTDLAPHQCPYHLSVALLITGAEWDGKDYTADNVLDLCVLKLAISLETAGDKC